MNNVEYKILVFLNKQRNDKGSLMFATRTELIQNIKISNSDFEIYFTALEKKKLIETGYSHTHQDMILLITSQGIIELDKIVEDKQKEWQRNIVFSFIIPIIVAFVTAYATNKLFPPSISKSDMEDTCNYCSISSESSE